MTGKAFCRTFAPGLRNEEMNMEKLIHFLEGMKMTIVGGVALLVSLGLLLAGISVAFDPAWITIVICGLPLLWLAVTRLIYQRWVSSALLIVVAMIACIYIGELFAAGEVAFIMALGALLEDYAVARAKRGVNKLLSLAPDEARLIDGNETRMVSAKDITVGNVVRVLPGEKITVDGEVVAGSTSIDQSIITGESLPIDKTVGDSVFCGTMNCYGSIDIRATKAGEDTSLKKMIRMVQEAEANKAPMQRIVDKWAAWLVFIALGIAIAAYLITSNLERAVTVLVVFCPCALALATPVSIIAGIGQATKYGVLIKSGEALETMGRITSIAFDKTGTLTRGELSVSDVVIFNSNYQKEDIINIAAACEARSEHPLGKAIVAANKSKEDIEAADFTMTPGKGICAKVEGKQAVCGKRDYLVENGICLSNDVQQSLEKLSGEGKASVLVGYDGQCIGLIALSDVLRPEARNVMGELAEMGIETVVLTGDNRHAAEYMTKQLGISQYRAELLPADKVSAISRLQQEGKTICMVGDGVNDAPALKTAAVSVAMGSMGSDIAIETADIALMGDDLSRLPYLKRLSNAVVFSIKFNITLSMVINFIAITLSVIGLLNPVTGALVHNVGSVLVVLNAALLYDRKI